MCGNPGASETPSQIHAKRREAPTVRVNRPNRRELSITLTSTLAISTNKTGLALTHSHRALGYSLSQGRLYKSPL
jgi:hypothetical protein